MSYLAFARKYRPRTFEDVVGQEAIAQALRTAVATGRTASVYLFSGSHGVGKTSMARILAKALNCPNASEGRPCLTCETCQSIDRGEAFDVLEIDAASNRGVDDAERIRQNVRTRGSARHKIYILDEVHQLSRHAFDALLKTFEEAPEHVRFILATTELHKVPSTIRSRAQVFHFHRSTRQAIETRLGQIAEAEGLAIEPAALTLIARRARGSMRDAQKLLDQAAGLGQTGPATDPGAPIRVDDVANVLGTLAEERVERVLGALAAAKAGPLLVELDDYLAKGGRSGTFIEDLQEAMRAVLYLKACGAESPLLEEVAYDREHLQPVAAALSEDAILYALTILQDAEVKMRTAREPRVVLEVCLVRMARMAELRPIGEVLARLERLEQALEAGGAPARSAAAAPPGRSRLAGHAEGRSPTDDDGPRDAGERARRAHHPDVDDRGGSASAARTHAAIPGPPSGAAAGRGDGRRGTYAYPATMAAPAAPAPAAPPDVSARQLVELDRAARLDRPALAGPTGGRAADDGAWREAGAGSRTAEPAQALTQATAQAAWTQVQPGLPDALGMTASLLERGQPRLRVEQGELVIEVCWMSDMLFGQLADPSVTDALARLLAGPLGGPPKVRFVRGAKAEGPPAAGAPTPGQPARARSLYDDPIVKQAQRELASTPVTRED